MAYDKTKIEDSNNTKILLKILLFDIKFLVKPNYGHNSYGYLNNIFNLSKKPPNLKQQFSTAKLDPSLNNFGIHFDLGKYQKTSSEAIKRSTKVSLTGPQ